VGNTPIRALRVPDEVWFAALARAHGGRHSLAEVVRQFLRAYAAGDPLTYVTATGNVLTAADVQQLADEAEAGYDVDLTGTTRRLTQFDT